MFSKEFWRIPAVSLMAAGLVAVGLASGIFRFFYFLSCLPVVLIFLKDGWKSAVLAMTVLALLVAVMVDWFFAGSYVLVFGGITAALCLAMKRGWSAFRTVALSSGVSVILMLAWVIAAGAFLDVHPVRILKGEMRRSANAIMEAYRNEKSPVLGKSITFSEEELAKLELDMRGMVGFVERALPSCGVILSILGVGLAYFTAVKVFPRYGVKVNPFPPFSLWRPKEEVVWGLIVGGILYFAGMYGGKEVLRNTGFNIGIFFLSLYFVSGMAIASYFFSRYGIPAFLRAAGYILLVFQYVLVMGVGLIDVWFNFRRRMSGLERSKDAGNTT